MTVTLLSGDGTFTPKSKRVNTLSSQSDLPESSGKIYTTVQYDTLKSEVKRINQSSGSSIKGSL